MSTGHDKTPVFWDGKAIVYLLSSFAVLGFIAIAVLR
jgi:hypothetical protein